MRTTQQYSITLPHDMAEIVEQKIESGAYATVSEVVRDGMRALMERDAAMEKWLCTDVVRSYNQMKANPRLGVPLHKAFAKVKAKIGRSRSFKRT